MKRILISVLFVVLLLVPEVAAAEKKPRVVVYATGGTIAGSSQESTDTTDYHPGVIGVDALIDAVPQISSIAEVSGGQIANIGSNNITQDIVLKLSKEIYSGLEGFLVWQGLLLLMERIRWKRPHFFWILQLGVKNR